MFRYQTPCSSILMVARYLVSISGTFLCKIISANLTLCAVSLCSIPFPRTKPAKIIFLVYHLAWLKRRLTHIYIYIYISQKCPIYLFDYGKEESAKDSSLLSSLALILFTRDIGSGRYRRDKTHLLPRKKLKKISYTSVHWN